MRTSLHDKVLKALQDRQPWEDKQRVFYAMRHEGLRRRRPPFPGAADMHYPLIDGAIEKLKPFYFNQLFTDEKLAEFTATEAEAEVHAEAAAEYFDHVVKEETDFLEELMSAADTMLMRQMGILKTFWDVREKKVCVEVVDPLFFIVPSTALGPDKDDWFVHVKPMSVAEYRRNTRYERKDEAFIQAIAGSSRDESAHSNTDQERIEREGLTFTKDPDQLIIWEVWEKTASGWIVKEYSPSKPNEMVKRPIFCPYAYQGKAWQPFVGLVFEIKDKGWYAPRGVAERLGSFESALCKQWNEKLDNMTFLNRPLFERPEGDLPNTGSIRFRPGELLPKGVKPVQMPSPPHSHDQEMSLTRGVAEQYLALPEAGLAADPTKGGKGDGKPTATQVQYHANLQSGTTNMRGWVFRQCLSAVYWRIWALLVQFQPEDMAYRVGKMARRLPQEALKAAYRIQPAGPIDGWNKQQRQQRAGMRFQAFNNDPLINQEELRRDVLAADDARLVDRLLMPNGMQAANEQEDEAMEILLLESGYPAVAGPAEDHLTRAQVLVQRLEALGQLGAPVNELARQRIQQHLATHLKYLQAQNPKVAREFIAQLSGGGAPPDGMPPAGGGPMQAQASGMPGVPPAQGGGDQATPFGAATGVQRGGLL